MHRPAAFAIPLLLLLGAAQQARAQKPTAVVKTSADVDGDGRIDQVRLDETGAITVLITGRPAAGAWTTLAASGKVVGGSLQVHRDLAPGRTIILVRSILRTARARKREEAVVLAYSPGKLRPMWRGAVGMTGRDGAIRLSLEVGPYGLIKYASRHGVTRCDGKTAHLAAERYDFKRNAFRPARQALRVDSETVLRSQNSPPEGISPDARGFLFAPRGASSSLRAASVAELVAPLEVADGDDKTAWVESKGGFGRGEFITLKTRGAVPVRALRLVLGHGGAIRDFNRPRRMGLLLGKSHPLWIEVPADPRTAQWVVLPEPVSTDCVTLLIDDVYPARASKANRGRTAISEINILSTAELQPASAAAALARRISTGKAGADIDRLLEGLGAEAATALVQAIAEAKDGRSRTRLRLALARLPAAPAELATGLADDELRSNEHEELRLGLQKIGGRAVPALAAALGTADLSDGAARRLAELLARMPEEDAGRVLLDALGKGRRAQRSAVVRALASRPTAWALLLTAVETPGDAKRQADLYRALGAAAAQMERSSALRLEIARAVVQRLDSAPMAYEARYRLLQAAGAIGTADMAAALLAQRLTLESSQDAEALALLRVTVGALASLPRALGDPGIEEALRVAVLESLSHTDPGVRLAAIQHMTRNASAVDAIVSRLESDAWPELRRAAAAALAPLCDSPTSIAALVEATRTEADASTARTALHGVIGCAPRTLRKLLLDLVDDRERPLDLRLQAARRLGSHSGAKAAAAVLSRFKRARRLALSDQESGKIASALTVALAELGTQEAIGALESAASDPAFPELQAAAVTALGSLCPTSSQRLLRRLEKSHEHSVSMAARRAAERCR